MNAQIWTIEIVNLGTITALLSQRKINERGEIRLKGSLLKIIPKVLELKKYFEKYFSAKVEIAKKK